jgi:hypothetical protein
MNNGNGMFGGQMQGQGFPGMMGGPQPGFEFPPVAGGMEHAAPQQYGLPAALLAQYPALATLQWDQLPAGGPEEVEGDISGRSSYDASSGGELFDDEGEYPAPQAVYSGGWASDYEANAR